MCGGSKSAPPAEKPKPVDTAIADRQADSAAVASEGLRPRANGEDQTGTLGNPNPNAGGSPTTSVLGG